MEIDACAFSNKTITKLSPELHQELSIAAAHQVAATLDGATHLVAKMATWMRPIFFDTASPEQGNGDLLMRCSRKRAIQSLEHETETRSAGLRRKASSCQAAATIDVVQELKGSDMELQVLRLHDRVDI